MPSNMTPFGWSKQSFAVGDQVTVTLEPVKNGQPLGRILQVLLPDGKTLVGVMQSPLLQDGGTDTGLVTRIVTIDIRTGWTREYAYPLDTVKTTVSEILAVNNHEFLLDERDSKGFADLGRAQVCGRNWCNPAYAGGRLYLRDSRELMCVSLLP